MNTQHTPGPWKVNENGWVIGANGETIVSHHPMTYLEETAQADARLIAAAPELLMACQLVRYIEDAHDQGNWDDMDWPSIIEQFRAAIHKATQP